MKYKDYEVTLHSIKVPVIMHLSEQLDRVEKINAKRLLPEPNVMLRKLGQWVQEFYSPLEGSKGAKLFMYYGSELHTIYVYFGGDISPHLTIRYHPET